MKKKLVALALCVALLAVAVIGGTLAYFTDTDAETNEFTVGNIDIDLVEDYDQNSKLMPGEENAVKKEVTVKVEAGSDDAFVWYEYLIPESLKDVLLVGFNEEATKWSDAEVVGQEEIDGVTYDVYVCKYSDVMAAEAVTEVGLNKIYLTEKLDYDNENGEFILVTAGTTEAALHDFNAQNAANNVIVRAYGIQAATFEDVEEAYAAFQAQWTAPTPQD